ncbi:hypothetical protein JR316_0003879 [Psilocybe cubensis]|uniref:F-box domain-containing protein n=2 Tax=Psilocybe cubensis TaxID=181762 RepID=A0A8H8CME1_PSICU|nr:hypothetical protein JR316_0003879 [Psilocybe cubensis]KAH9484398.1 hypothetical protein JR316_0003879 [Psilocybe cubensis]
MLTGNRKAAIERIPTEIWTECADQLSFNDQKNLLLTCQFFRDVCLRFVFKHKSFYLHVCKDMGSGNCCGPFASRVENVALVADSNALAPHVRKLTLRYDQSRPRTFSHQLKQLYPLFIKSCLELIPRFPNLRSVYISSNKPVDKALMHALALCPQLDELGMGPVRFGAHSLSRGVRLCVRKLGIYNNCIGSDTNPRKAAKVLDMFSGERLERLEVLSHIYAPKIAHALARQSNCTRLTFLRVRISPEDFKTFIPFLVSCANIEALSVTLHESLTCRDSAFPPHSFPNSLPQLPTSALRKLNSITGSGEIIALIVPGRRVQSVTTLISNPMPRFMKLDQGEFEALVLPRLVESKGPVKSLVLEGNVFGKNMLNPISLRMPSLTSLCVWLGDDSGVDTDPFKEATGTLAIVREYLAHCKNTPGNEAKVLTPFVRHKKYLIILHLIALGKIRLPRDLEQLDLVDRAFSVSWEQRLFQWDHCHLMKSEETHGTAYSLNMVSAIFFAISRIYPSFRLLNLSDHAPGHVYFYWYKTRSDKWDLCDFKCDGY